MSVRVIIVHGFGGRSFHSTEVKNLQEHAHNIAPNEITVMNFGWNSLATPNPKYTIANWSQAKIDAEKDGVALAEALGASRVPTYVVAHSLGTAVVLAALRHLGEAPSLLRGCFFFGAAVPKNADFTFTVPENVFVWNYFSSDDSVLSKLFASTELTPAAGLHGFDVDPERPYVTNIRTRRGHFDYLDLKKIAIEFVAYELGRRSPRRASPNTKEYEETGGGKTHWDDVAHIDDKLIQRHLGGWFRKPFWFGATYRVIGATAPHLLYATASDFRAAYEYACSAGKPGP